MTLLEIVEIGHPALRARAREVDPAELESEQTQKFIDDLIETMRWFGGAGLAAPQVDVPLRIFAVEVSQNARYPYKPAIPLRVLVNPRVTVWSDERYDSYEGCLSIANLRGLLPRATEIEIAYQDRSGAPVRERVRGLSAGTLQHELDHLDGVLFVDRVEDPTTLCTWEQFRVRHQAAWVSSVAELIAGDAFIRLPDEEHRHQTQ